MVTLERTVNISLDDEQLESIYELFASIYDSVDMGYDSNTNELSLLLISDK